MILLDTDHLSVLTDPRQALRIQLMDRLQASGDAVAIPVPAVEEQLRAWLAQIHRVVDVSRQIAPYQRLLKLIVCSVTFDPPGRTLASGSADETVKLWEGRSDKLLRRK